MSNPRSTKHFYRQMDENKNQIRYQSFHMLCGILYFVLDGVSTIQRKFCAFSVCFHSQQMVKLKEDFVQYINIFSGL